MFWLFSLAHWFLKDYSRVFSLFFSHSKNIILLLKSTKLRVVDKYLFFTFLYHDKKIIGLLNKSFRGFSNINIQLKYDFCLRKDKKKIRFVFGRIFVLSHRFFR
jgi:hypothetical protein